MTNTTKRQVIDEPPGFSEAWARLTAGNTKRFGGAKQAYCELFRAGQESLRDPIVQSKLGLILIDGPVTKPTPHAPGAIPEWSYVHQSKPTGLDPT